jgi:transposase
MTLIPPARRGGGKPLTDMRAVINACCTSLPPVAWRYIPKDFRRRSTCMTTLYRIHHALYLDRREKAEREASLHRRAPFSSLELI